MKPYPSACAVPSHAASSKAPALDGETYAREGVHCISCLHNHTLSNSGCWCGACPYCLIVGPMESPCEPSALPTATAGLQCPAVGSANDATVVPVSWEHPACYAHGICQAIPPMRQTLHFAVGGLK